MKNVKNIPVGEKTAKVLRPIVGAVLVLGGIGGTVSLIAGGFTVGAEGFLASLCAVLMLASGLLVLLPKCRRAARISALALLAAAALRFVLRIVNGGDLDLLLAAEALLAWLCASLAAGRADQ